MKTYHIDLGDSTSGSFGAVVCINAESAEDALAIAKEKLDGAYLAQGHDIPVDGLEYLRIYVHTEKITMRDVSEG